jgi:hypothetical protein
MSLPAQVTLTGPSLSIFQQAAYLCTQGYTFNDWQMDQAIPSIGQSVLIMVLKGINAADITAAKKVIGQ